MATNDSAEMSAVEKKFMDYDWTTSEKWQLYLSNLYPTPPASKIMKWKKKWYKANIDPEFDISSTVGEVSQPDEAPAASSATSTTASSSGPSPAAPTATNTTTTTTTTTRPPAAAYQGLQGNATAKRLTVMLRVAALLLSLSSLVMPSRVYALAVTVHILSCMAAVVAKFGMPKFNMEWAQPVVHDDIAVALFFSISAFSLKGNWMALASPCITAALGLAEVYNDFATIVPAALASKLRVGQGVQFLNLHRYQVMQFRANLELMVGVVTLVLFFMAKQTFMTAMLYWNALRSAYQVNSFTQSSFQKLNATIEGLLSHGILPPSILRMYQSLAGYIHSYGSAAPPGSQEHAS